MELEVEVEVEREVRWARCVTGPQQHTTPTQRRGTWAVGEDLVVTCESNRKEFVGNSQYFNININIRLLELFNRIRRVRKITIKKYYEVKSLDFKNININTNIIKWN